MKLSALLYGAVIEQGPQDWQILQQKDGKTDIHLAGQWYLDETTGQECVFARVVDENSSATVIGWTQGEVLEDRRWTLTLKDVPAGGLYRIDTCLRHEGDMLEWAIRGDSIHHVGVGDLYVVAGQSNAAGFGRDPIYDPPELGVHLLKNKGRWDLASHPINDSTDTLHPVNRDRANSAHSPYIQFAKQLKRQLGYPVGLIQASRGGSALASWNPDEGGELYDNMVGKIKQCGGSIKGILWYQGCTDAGNGRHADYGQRFAIIVERLRSDLSDPALPFLTVQLNRYVADFEEDRDAGWGTVREAQRTAARSIGQVFVAPALDLGLGDSIHNRASSNMALGERLARLALHHLYGIRSYCDAPDIVEAAVVGDRAIALTFAPVFGALGTYLLPADELPFTVKDMEDEIRIAKYKVEQRRLILELERPIRGQATVSCAAERNPKGLMPYDSGSMLPLLSFYEMSVGRPQ